MNLSPEEKIAGVLVPLFALRQDNDEKNLTFAVEGVGNTPAVLLFKTAKPPKSVTLDSQEVHEVEFLKDRGLLYIHFENEARPRMLAMHF